MYYHIKKHKLQSEKMKEKLLITGGFNCRLGNMIEGNTNEISKYGKIMLKTITDEDLVILNASEKCEATWTRIEGDKKSVIDYILVSKEDKNYLNKMTIDEKKIITPCYVVQNRMVYSDHCAILIKMNWLVASIKDNKQNKSTNFKEGTSKEILTEVVGNETDIRSKYTKWQQSIDKLIENTFEKKVKKKYNKPKKIQKLYKEKRRVKNVYTNIKHKTEKIKHN